MSMQTIETHATAYATARQQLAESVSDLQAQIDAATRRAMPALRELVATAGDCHASLLAAIEAAPALFEKPRTRTFAGIKVGYSTQRGSVEIDDEGKTIARIRELLPTDQAVLLITVKESVHKPSVADLTTADLKRLGIRVTGPTEVPVIKPTDSAIDKAVKALLSEVERIDADVA